jgi:serine O-acetyltransferase
MIGDSGLLALIREDWIAHERDWTRPGFRALLVARVGKLQVESPRPSVRFVVRHVYRVAHRYVRNHYGIELPYTLTLGRRVVIEHQGGIVAHGYAELGDDCIVRQGVTIGNRHLDRPFDAPKLGARVNIGAGAKILGAVSIGDDVQIGANAVVLVDVPSGTTAAGVPAVVVRRHTSAVRSDDGPSSGEPHAA